ncbi:MAG: hypothetical protein JNM91_03170 [Flavobacteriales bacterium]|nr:hypothetical protein [Flavobacteriales bacterium]
MKTDTRLFRTLKWTVIYAALALGLWWLHNPLDVSMDAAASTVKFVYQQF